MHPKKVRELIESEFQEITKLFDEKNKAYAEDENALGNFDKQALLAKKSPFDIWVVLANKHDIAINNAIANNPAHPVDYSEGIRSRIRDRIVYSLLFLALLERVESKEATEVDNSK